MKGESDPESSSETIAAARFVKPLTGPLTGFRSTPREAREIWGARIRRMPAYPDARTAPSPQPSPPAGEREEILRRRCDPGRRRTCPGLFSFTPSGLAEDRKVGSENSTNAPFSEFLPCVRVGNPRMPVESPRGYSSQTGPGRIPARG